MSVFRAGLTDVTSWARPVNQEVFLADLADHTKTGALSLGAARYGAGTALTWTVAYDEAIIVLKGAFTVTPDGDEAVTARTGEVIFVSRGTSLTYSADEETDMIVVMNPHWQTALEDANLLHLLDGYAEVKNLGDPMPETWANG